MGQWSWTSDYHRDRAKAWPAAAILSPMPEQPTLHRDDHLLVVSKPVNLAVHRGLARDPVYAMTLARDAAGQWVYPVHRLDRPTSGVLVFALDSEAARAVAGQFEAGTVAKRYLALVRGIPEAAGVIDHPVPKDPGAARVPAVTEFRRLWGVDLGERRRYAWMEARPRTGRLHQIRRHFKHRSHPLIGDVRYGKGEHNRFFRERYGLHRLALHAFELTFEHPATGGRMTVRAPLPEDLARPLDRLGVEPREPD